MFSQKSSEACPSPGACTGDASHLPDEREAGPPGSKWPRTTHRYTSRADTQLPLRLRLRELAQVRVAYGYRRLHVLLKREGWQINHKRVSSARAVAKGRRFRDLDTTVGDTLAWHSRRPAEQQLKLRAGLTADREAELLKKLKAG